MAQWKFDTQARKSVTQADAAMLRSKARSSRHAANAKARSWSRSGSVADALGAWDDYSEDPTPLNAGKYLKHI